MLWNNIKKFITILINAYNKDIPYIKKSKIDDLLLFKIIINLFIQRYQINKLKIMFNIAITNTIIYFVDLF